MHPIAGRVKGARKGQRIVLFARSGMWWVQPLAADPFTKIQPDSRWRSTTHPGSAYAALLVSFFIIKVGLEILWGALREMADTAPAPDVIDSIMDCIRSVPNVIEVHDLKVRIVGGRYSMSVHVVVDPMLTLAEGHRAAEEVEQCLISEVDAMEEVVVHIDPAQSPEKIPEARDRSE